MTKIAKNLLKPSKYMQHVPRGCCNPCFYTRVKKMTKITRHLPKSSKYIYRGNIFLLFCLNYYFWKFCHFAPKKIQFVQKVIFQGFLVKIFKHKKLLKKSEKTFPRYMYLDDFGKCVVIFVKKYLFTLVQKFWRQKSLFGDFSQMQF